MDDEIGIFGDIDELLLLEDYAEQSEEIIYCQFARRLMPLLPKTIKSSKEDTSNFLVTVLKKIDTNESWDYIKEGAMHRKLLRWLSKDWWTDIKTKFAGEHDQPTDDDLRLLSLLDKIINYKKRSMPKKRKLHEVLAHEESTHVRKRLKQTLSRDYENDKFIYEEDIYHDSNFVTTTYGKFAKRLATLVPIRKKHEAYTIEDKESFISYVLLKFDRKAQWKELPAGKILCSRFDRWRRNENWHIMQDKFLRNHDKDSNEDRRILSLLEMINNHQIRQRKLHKRKDE